MFLQPQQQTVILFGDSSGYFGKKKITSMEPANDIYGSGFLLTDVVGPVSWDFDNDGDVDIAGSNIGPLYVGATTTIWANDGRGNFTVADQTPLVPSPDFVKTREGFQKNIKMETNAYNSFCTRNVLIDVNNDGFMDIMCQGSPQDVHGGWFFVNNGKLEFNKVSPYKAWENGWVDFYTTEFDGPNREFEGFSDPDMMDSHWYSYKKDQFVSASKQISFFENDVHNFSELLIIDVDGEGKPGAFNDTYIQFYRHNLKMIIFGGLPLTSEINKLVGNPRVSAICFGNPLCYQEHTISRLRSKISPELIRSHKLL